MDIENANPVGNLRISNEVISTVARLATLEIDGVLEVTTGASGVKKLITRTNYTKPIKIELNESSVAIEINIVVENKRKIPDIALEIQKNVKSSIENMTSLKVDRVDVVVVGIASKPADGKQD